ncbi:hypothetical protein T484DRAFT_1862679, partial [Baffinella frigidus]
METSVCLASGREDFLHMKRTQHELAMIMCEDDRYELDMLIELNLDMLIELNVSAISSISKKIAVLEAHEAANDRPEAVVKGTARRALLADAADAA